MQLIGEDLEWLSVVKLASVSFELCSSRQWKWRCSKERDLQPLQLYVFLCTSGACDLVKAVSVHVCFFLYGKRVRLNESSLQRSVYSQSKGEIYKAFCLLLIAQNECYGFDCL